MAITSADIKAALKKKRAAKRAGTWHGFDALKNELASRGGKSRANRPAALAAWIGRKKFGKKGFQALAMAGRRGMSGD